MNKACNGKASVFKADGQRKPKYEFKFSPTWHSLHYVLVIYVHFPIMCNVHLAFPLNILKNKFDSLLLRRDVWQHRQNLHYPKFERVQHLYFYLSSDISLSKSFNHAPFLGTTVSSQTVQSIINLYTRRIIQYISVTTRHWDDGRLCL